jgi:hypothetical protein
MNFSRNSDFNFSLDPYEVLELEEIDTDRFLKKCLFKTAEHIHILSLDKPKLEIFNEYNNLLCILKNIKNLLDKIEIDINQGLFKFDELSLNFNHESINLKGIVKKDDRVNEIVYYISTIMEFIAFYKSNLVLDIYFKNLKCLLIKIIQLLKILLEKIMPIQEGIFVPSIEYLTIIEDIINKLFELKNISKFWIYIISQIPKNTKKVIIFDYENLMHLSSNFAIENNQYYSEANFINKLCASINSFINNKSGIILYNFYSKLLERSENLREDGYGEISDTNSYYFYPHTCNCFINRKGEIIKPEEVTLIFIHKSDLILSENIHPLLILQKYNYNVLKIKVSAIISFDGEKLNMDQGKDRTTLNQKTKHDTFLHYLKEFDDSFCIFLLYTLKQNAALSVFLLSTDKYVDIKGSLYDINDSFIKTRSRYMDKYIEKIIIDNINDEPIYFDYDLSLMNTVGVDVKKISSQMSDKQIYRKQEFSTINTNTNYNIFYKKYLKYKQKYLKLKNN